MPADAQTLLPIGQTDAGETLGLTLAMANRHGLIAGATGVGKTVTLKVLVEQFSAAGVPTVVTDIKGDLAGLALPGERNEKLAARLAQLGDPPWTPQAFPAVFWDVFGQQGHPLRATASDMGPALLGRLLTLTDVQQDVLTVLFHMADAEGLLLLDLKDVAALVDHVLTLDSAARETLTRQYGQMAPASLGALQRKLAAFAAEDAQDFFGEPALALSDLLQAPDDGPAPVHLLACDRLFLKPRAYASVLLWLLSELFESLPEAGDLEKPKLALFFDEAHLLFEDMPDALLTQLVQTARLIRSKGVGLYFITQNPGDLPDAIVGQLGNRVQHALRITSPNDRKALKSLVAGFPENPALDLETLIPQLAIGQAVASFLKSDGAPGPAQTVWVHPPRSRFGAISEQERAACLHRSPLAGRYERALDRESAYERLQQRVASPPADAAPRPQASTRTAKTDSTESFGGGLFQTFLSSAIRTIGYQVGRELTRGLLGSPRRRRR